MKPIAKWDSNEMIYPGLLWWSRLDKRYQVEVHANPKNSYLGTLYIFDHNDGDKEIHNQPVGVAYGAMFGPDMGDVDNWCEISSSIIDALNDGTASNS